MNYLLFNDSPAVSRRSSMKLPSGSGKEETKMDKKKSIKKLVADHFGKYAIYHTEKITYCNMHYDYDIDAADKYPWIYDGIDECAVK